jgi:hypothetical protein
MELENKILESEKAKELMKQINKTKSSMQEMNERSKIFFESPEFIELVTEYGIRNLDNIPEDSNDPSILALTNSDAGKELIKAATKLIEDNENVSFMTHKMIAHKLYDFANENTVRIIIGILARSIGDAALKDEKDVTLNVQQDFIKVIKSKGQEFEKELLRIWNKEVSLH